MADEKKPNIFTKVLQATEAQLDRVIAKAKTDVGEEKAQSQRPDDGANFDLLPAKSVLKDPSYSTGIQGYQEKTARLSYVYLKQMAYKDSIVAGVIQTRQNQVAAFSKPVKHKYERGFRITLKDEEEFLEKLRQEVYGQSTDPVAQEQMEPEEFLLEEPPQDPNAPKQEPEPQLEEYLLDAPQEGAAPQSGLEEGSDPSQPADPSMPQQDPGEAIEAQQEQAQFEERQREEHLREEMQKRVREKVKYITNFVANCGETEGRPFDNEKWDLDSYFRAIVRDSLSYDQFSTELVPNEAGELHHFIPMDGSTIRQATPQLKNYGNFDTPQMAGYDILYPEKELQALEEKTDALELDEAKLENDDYVWVQVINGRVVRAYTKDELAVGMRNPQTDIYANGYSVSELELLLSVVTQHIFAENYNKSYYTNGFSAKGILHIKANLPRRKLESFRVMWNHMIKGNRNSFQTPILAGMEEVQWIPLTQNHSDIEFSEYINYLIKLICSIYQIDPSEIGFGMQEEGGSGGGMAGDNTEVKIKQSKDKGLAPFLRYIENYINKHIISRLDPDFKFEFVGIHDENQTESVNRQKEEVRFKKTVNEIRAEDGLPPIPGADGLILDPIYFQWYSVLHPDGKMIGDQKAEEARQRMIENGLVEDDGEGEEGEEDPQDDEKSDQPSDEELAADAEAEFGDKGRDADQDEGLRDRGRPEKFGKSRRSKRKRKVAIEYYSFEK